MSGNWLDLSSSSNRFQQAYVQGFVDVSGGNVLLRAGPTNNNHLILEGGDISLNGRLNVATGTSASVYKNFYGKVPPTTSATSTYAFSTYALPTVSPNSTNATSNTWTNSGVTWTSSASSNGAFAPFHAFNTLLNTNECWHDDATGYTSATGVANTNFQTVVYTTGSSGATSTYNGQWLQIQSSVGLSMKTFYFSPRVNINFRLPQVFYIVGSNTGTGTWTPIFKGDTASTTGAISATSATVSLPDLGSSGTISNFYDTTSLTYTTYGNLVYTVNNFTYFRLIVSEICGGDNTCNIAEWGLTFSSSPTTATQTGPSRALIYMDASNINQVDVSGSLGLINSSPTSMTVSPNTTAATSKTWINNNITWDASASSVFGSCYPYTAFNNGFLTGGIPWVGAAANYSTSTGSYNAAGPAGTLVNTGSIVNISGDWLQIQSSSPLIMKNYYLGTQYSSPADLPGRYTIAGSNDGTTWFALQDASFTAWPGHLAASNVATDQTTFTYPVSAATTGVLNNNSITSYGNQTNAYSYFRLIIKSLCNGQFSAGGIGGYARSFWNPTFTPAASSVSLALDNATPNQLNIGGSLCISNNVGIGTTAPAYPLDVNGTIRGQSDFGLQASSATWNATLTKGLYMRYSTNSNQDSGYIQAIDRTVATPVLYPLAIEASTIKLSGSTSINLGTTSTTQVSLTTSNGYVGIGTTSPLAPLHVYTKSGLQTITGSGYYLGNNTSAIQSYGSGAGSGELSIITGGSILASGALLATTATTYSDERIKKNINDIDDNVSLVELRKLKPKTYNYIDVFKQGVSKYYGFIAQEVEAVIPNAVYLCTQYIPSIYEIVNIANGKIITLINKSTTDFAKDASGNLYKNIKLYDSSNNEILRKIVDIIDETTFEIDDTIDSTELFMYGQEVDNLRSLDKDSIFTITTAAVQQIDREFHEAKQTIQTLEARLAAMDARLSAAGF